MRVQQFIESLPTKTAAARAQDGLETAFLGEMLKIAMPPPAGAFSGGTGESQFSSFMTEHYAAALADRMDLGLTIAGVSPDA